MAKELDDATLGAWRALLSAQALVVRRVEAALAAEGMPPLGWYDVLWAVYDAPQRRLRVGELANAVVLSPTGMSRMVERLVQAGMLERKAVPEDRRGAYAAITEEGIALLRRMWPVYARVLREVLEPQLDDSNGLRATLSAVADAARAASGGPSASPRPLADARH